MNRLFVATALALCACDWDQAALLDAIPRSGSRAQMEVYLAVDGVSREALEVARSRGAFADFEVSTLVPMYPATSDASWSRLLHAPPIAGYEYTYFDPATDKVMHPGLEGLAGHAIPPAERDADFPYYRAFDMHGEGYGDALQGYADPEAAFAERLDNLFVTLGGRVGQADVFTAYILEMDVVAHGEGIEAMVQMLETLSRRMAKFQGDHPGVDVRFTLMSDHGSDHVAKARVVSSGELLKRVGVTPVDSLAAGSAVEGPWAVAEEHSRTTYGVAHTPPEWIEEVARRISTDETIDVVVSRADAPAVSFAATQWTALFRAGERIARVGYDESTGDSWLERAGQWSSLGITLTDSTDSWVRMSDAALFSQSNDGDYPDLVFRARTSLLPLSVRNPAQIIFSLKEHCVMRGFQVPGSDSLGASGSHGALGGGGSRGVLLSQSRSLPAMVRSDDVLGLFPSLREHVEGRLAHSW